MSSTSPGRAKAGFSDKSFHKHRVLERIATAQANAFRIHHQQARILLIDTHAGDAQGIGEPQLNFFENEISRPSPLALADIFCSIGAADLMVCERRAERRESLRKNVSLIVPSVQIFDNNQRLLDVNLKLYDWALILCDPCGYSSRGEGFPMAVLHHIMSRIPSDLIATFNQGSVDRIKAVADEPMESDTPQVSGMRKAKQNYMWIEDLSQWAARLNRRCAARSKVVRQSRGFRFRLIVVADYFSSHINQRDWEIYRERG